MAKIPHFEAGQRRLSAAHLNRLVDVCNAFLGLTGDGVIEISHVGTGATARVNPNRLAEKLSKRKHVIPCLVTKDGGVAGSSSTECSYTYTVKDLDDATVLRQNAYVAATGMTPEKPRHHNCAYWYAGEARDAPGGATSRYAIACRASDGTLKLLVAFGETPKTEECWE